LIPLKVPGVVHPVGVVIETVVEPVATGVNVTALPSVPGAILTELGTVPAPRLVLVNATFNATLPASGWLPVGLGVFSPSLESWYVATIKD
jgi:hypothetical protein